MSNLKYAIVEEEIVTTAGGSAATENNLKPFVVSQRSNQPGNALTRRVEAVLDFEFANGSMPA